MGWGALYTSTTSNDTAVGEGALFGQTSGGGNVTAIGQGAGYNNNAPQGVFIGSLAGYGASAYTAQGDVFVGYESGYGISGSTGYNVGLGWAAGYKLTTGTHNILIGSSTGLNTLTTGSDNILICTGETACDTALSSTSDTFGLWDGSTAWMSGTAGNTSDPLLTIAGQLTVDQNLIVANSHLLATSTTPGISSCGTGSPSVAGSDNFGTISAGGGTLTSCVINFGHTWGTAPACTVSFGTSAAAVTVTTSTTQLTVAATSLTSYKIFYTCGSVSKLEPANDNFAEFRKAA